MSKRCSHWFIAPLLSLLLQGCVSLPKPNSGDGCGPTDAWASKYQADEPAIFRIALTDDGELIYPCEKTRALTKVGEDHPQVVVLFVHGWKHNFDPEDTNAEQFQDFVKELHARESKRGTRRVIGIYVGWQGKRIDMKGLEEFTFWSRRRAADYISRSGIVTKIVASIQNIQKDKNVGIADPSGRHSAIYLGHSFGARILFESVLQPLLVEASEAFPANKSTFRPLAGQGDIVVLLNPAFEASAYTHINAYRDPGEKFSYSQKPLLLTISSEGDSATSFWFPLAQLTSFHLSTRRRTTLGNYKPYQTHCLEAGTTHCLLSDAGGEWTSAAAWYDEFCAGSVCLKNVDVTGKRGNPFIVARASKEVSSSHNDIWTDELFAFLTEFVDRVQRQQQEALDPILRCAPSAELARRECLLGH